MWVVFSTAEESLPIDMPKDTLKIEFEKVIENLGLRAENFKIFNFRVRHLHENRQDVLEELIKIRDIFQPNMVLIPSLTDHHQDL